jgi:hypothetical protein
MFRLMTILFALTVAAPAMSQGLTNTCRRSAGTAST